MLKPFGLRSLDPSPDGVGWRSSGAGTHWGSRLRLVLVGLDVQTESDLESKAGISKQGTRRHHVFEPGRQTKPLLR
uniref:Uncharacterized protein n=1 Tax=Setaria italica TaxID=4555 RepID=K3XNY5_SETIT